MLRNLTLAPLTGLALSVFALSACSQQDESQATAPSSAPDKTIMSAVVTTETQASLTDSAAIALVINAGSGQAIVGAVEDGLEIYALQGERLGRVGSGEIESIAVIGDTVLALNGSTNQVVPFLPASGPNLFRMGEGFQLERLYEGLCAYSSGFDGNDYMFLLGSNGQIEQWQITVSPQGMVQAQHIRNLQTGTEPKYCTLDPFSNSLYVAEETVGIWRFDAHVEAEVIPELIDVVKFGHVSEEVAGLAVYRKPDGTAVLLASDVGTGTLNVFDINDDHRWLGSLKLDAQGSVDSVEGAEGISVNTEAGFLLVSDGDNGEEASNFKTVSLSDLDREFGQLAPAKPQPVGFGFAKVQASVETAPVDSGGDAADDPAIWVHPTNPAESLIIGTNKQGSLFTYNLDGSMRQQLPDGKINNVDIRYGVQLGDNQVTLVAASNRTHHSISFYIMDETTGMLIGANDGFVDTQMSDPYGLCMYQSHASGKTYVFMNEKDGLVQQWEVGAGTKAKVTARKVREFFVGSTAEGCAADDETGLLYVAEEDVALWRYSAEPDGGDARIQVASPETHKALKDDLEGVSIYYGENGKGYLVLSSQGNDSYAVFDRQEPYGYRGSFAVIAGASGIDGSSETDGLDVISTPLGPDFPFGVFVAQDGRNIAPAEKQNFKLVPWEGIASALKLDKTQTWNPRD